MDWMSILQVLFIKYQTFSTWTLSEFHDNYTDLLKYCIHYPSIIIIIIITTRHICMLLWSEMFCKITLDVSDSDELCEDEVPERTGKSTDAERWKCHETANICSKLIARRLLWRSTNILEKRLSMPPCYQGRQIQLPLIDTRWCLEVMFVVFYPSN